MKTLFLTTILSSTLLFGCGGGSSSNGGSSDSPTTSEPVTLNFRASSNGMEINCGDIYTGFGPTAETSVGLGDIRFFVSNIRLYNSAGAEIGLTLDNNEFQYNSSIGSVALIDMLSNDTGHCEAVAEATPRTNHQITGTVTDNRITRISFDVGVPQALMKEMISAGPVEDAPSPLNELNWSWAGGYRHFVINFTSMDASHMAMVNNSAFHIGSGDCGGNFSAGINALTDRDTCGRINTPTVVLDNFDPSTNTIVIDINEALNNIQTEDLVSDVWAEHNGDESICIDTRRNGGWCVTGQNFGLQCHSGTSQSACQSLFPNFGLDIISGSADSNTNFVFTME